MSHSHIADGMHCNTLPADHLTSSSHILLSKSKAEGQVNHQFEEKEKHIFF